jgi:hypothetical protein
MGEVDDDDDDGTESSGGAASATAGKSAPQRHFVTEWGTRRPQDGQIRLNPAESRSDMGDNCYFGREAAPH